MDFCFTGYREPLVDGARFEAVAACVMSRGLHAKISDVAPAYSLGFFKDYTQKEVDFVLQRGRSIVLAVECKLKAKLGAANLKSFARFKPQESILLVKESSVFESIGDNIYAISI